jgi:hypothetical protein
MRHLLVSVSALACAIAFAASTAHAQSSQSQVVPACGTPNSTYTVGKTLPDTQDQNGIKCTGGGASQVTPTVITPLDLSSTVATGGTFQTAIASSGSRTSCFVQNPTSATEPLFVHWTAASPTTSNSASLGPGASFSCRWENTIITGDIKVTATTNGHTYIATAS